MESSNDKSNSDKKLTQGNPRNAIIAGVVIVLFFFGGLGVLSAFCPFAGAVIAPGTVKVSSERKMVQHLEGGLVDKILVKEGDMVEAGQVLIHLKSSAVDASVTIIRGQVWTKTAQLARLKAESRFAEKIEWPREITEQVKTEMDLQKILNDETANFQSRRKNLFGKTELYNSQIEQLKQQIIGAREEFSAKEKIIANLQEELDAKQQLFEDNYIDKAQLLALQRSLAEYEGQKGSLRQTIAETEQGIEGLKLSIIDLRNSYQQEAISELSSVSDQVYELSEKLKPSLDQKERLEIKAPVAGEVINLMVHSEVAGVIRASEPVLEIVPKDAKLIIESRVQTQDITQVRKGQYVTVELTAFNRRTTPPVDGTVTYVSGDKLVQQTASGELPYYLVYVETDYASLKESGAYLAPGMPAVCYITTEERTIMGYLLDPLLENFDRALREGS